MPDETQKDRQRIEAVLHYWFGNIDGIDDTDLSKNRLWWMGHPDDDAEIQQRFAGTVSEALDGKLDHWTESARGTLALVLLLDQFTRVLGRGTPNAFVGDRAAQRISIDAIDRGAEQQLRFCERRFLCMPLMHAEDRDLARRSLSLCAELEQARADHRGTTQDSNSHAKQHADIVLRFGRYPHRNAILGRESTPEERDFLARGGPTFGQTKK